jgi:hypothetical protein
LERLRALIGPSGPQTTHILTVRRLSGTAYGQILQTIQSRQAELAAGILPLGVFLESASYR